MNRFKKGMLAYHTKMQVIAVVKDVGKDFVKVELSETLPLQDWNPKDVAPYDQEEALRKRLKKGGYLRSVYLDWDRKAKK